MDLAYFLNFDKIGGTNLSGGVLVSTGSMKGKLHVEVDRLASLKAGQN